MAEPLTRSEAGADGAAAGARPLADATLRLQRALASLEAAIAAGSGRRTVGAAPAEPPSYLAIELETAHWRERELQAAAAAASKALESAMMEVSRALNTGSGAEGEGVRDLALESAPGSPEDAGGSSPEEEPAE